MQFSTKSQYGLRAMVYLAKCKRRICPLKVISQEEEISFDYLEKIFSKLEKEGLVKAKKGARGGYSLAKSPKKIRVGKIIKALEDNLILVKCLGRAEKSICSREKKCLTKNFWKKIQNSLYLALNSLTLADLTKK